MTSFLTFRLHGFMAAWGGVAVGEIRESDFVPSRSALLGLLGAALGIRRDQQKDLDALSRSVAFAVRVDRAGEMIEDWHTVQSASDKALRAAPRTPRTRKDEIEASNNVRTGDRMGENPMLSHRSYRMDPAYSVAVHLEPGATCALEALARALREPVFTLALGRKSCPLSWPMGPMIVDAPDLVGALHAYDEAQITLFEAEPTFQRIADLALGIRNGAPKSGNRLLVWEEGMPLPSGLKADLKVRRWDEPGNRARWQFSQRSESRTNWPEAQ